MLTGMAGLALAAALLLDALWGEPRWLWSRLPHPAVLMGRAVALVDRLANRGRARRLKGVAGLVVLMALAGGIGIGLERAGSAIGPAGGILTEVLVTAILLAHRSLVDHVRAVATGLRHSPHAARRAVAQIVSRDTGEMDPPAIARSAIESAAENLSDGVVAPAFWFLIAGLPGILIYKMVNTADSMIGYRTPRYADFGWAAARTDDLLNLIPARLTAILIALTHGVFDWRAIARDAGRHRSPNAGWPEAALARALNIALAGPRSYDGQIRELAWVNPEGQRDIGPDAVDGAIAGLWRAWALMLALVLASALV